MDNSLTPAMVRPSERTAVTVNEPNSKPISPQTEHDGVNNNKELTRSSAPRPGIGWMLLTLVLVAGLFGGLFYLGWLPSQKRHSDLNVAAEQVKTAPIRVAIIKPKRSEAINKLMLPGEIQPERETTIYARTSGYLKSWKKDIGDHVDEGELLAEIDSPEVDIQLEQSKAALKQAEAVLEQSKAALEQSKTQKEQFVAQLGTARARLNLAELLQTRYQGLRGSGSLNDEMIVEKEADEKSAKSAMAAAQAAVASAEAATESARSTIGVSSANVEMGRVAITRLQVLKSFEKVTAPFAGIVTARKTEVGALVTGGSGTAGQALFQLANTDIVRVYVDVPQSAAPSIKKDQAVDLILREFPNEKFIGSVARTTRSIDPSSRTMRTEVRVPNPKGNLMAGMFAQIHLSITHAAPPLLLPGSALIVNADGTQVALVKNGRVHFQPVQIESDYGANIAIGSGLTEDDAVVANPSERLTEGAAVVAAQAAQ